MKSRLSALLLLALLTVLGGHAAWAQTKKVAGTVTSSEDGTPMAGVSVIRSKSNAGTQTDADGRFQIDANTGDVLVFSSTGFLSQEIRVGESSLLNVSLKPDGSSLGDVVVVGYGPRRRAA